MLPHTPRTTVFPASGEGGMFSVVVTQLEVMGAERKIAIEKIDLAR